MSMDMPHGNVDGRVCEHVDRHVYRQLRLAPMLEQRTHVREDYGTALHYMQGVR